MLKRLPLLLLLAMSTAGAVPVSIQLVENADGTFDTEFPNGDKPITPAASCSTWTCDFKGDAAGDIDEDSATQLTFSVSGTDDNGNIPFAYKSFASGDVQIIARVPATSAWSGNLENFTGAGVGLTEGTADGDYYCQGWLPFVETPRKKCGVPGAWSGETAASGTSPEYVGCIYDVSATEIKCFHSDDGSTWTQMGSTTTKELSYPILAYAFVNSHEAGVSTSITLTNVAASNTITITGDPPGGGDSDPFESPDNDVFGTGIDATADVIWRTGADIVTGWDFSYPSGTTPATNSGIYYFDRADTPPANFPGHFLQQTNILWKDLEPTDDAFDFSEIEDLLDAGPVHLNIRGMVKHIKDSNGNDTALSQWSAPSWLSGQDTTTEGIHLGRIVTNYNIYDPQVKAELLELIAAFGETDIPAHVNLKGAIIHGVSSTAGEEWTGKQASNASAIAAMRDDIIPAWVAAYGDNADKLAWLKEDPVSLFNASVVTGGTGVRGGAIERWLSTKTTPGNVDETGQILDSDGYLSVDPDFVVIAEDRHFQDQNEEYGFEKFTTLAKEPLQYRMANFRMLQMRRNIAALPDSSLMNPIMDKWMGLELGKNVNNAWDAWVVLMRTYAQSGGTKEINNLERWLYQRESNGATTPTLQTTHGFSPSNDNLPAEFRVIDRARMGTSIGITVDDDWITGAQSSVWKITYVDTGTGNLVMNYNNGGAGGTCTIPQENTGDVRTASCFTSDFRASATGMDDDLTLTSAGNIPVLMVRGIKCGGSFASCN